MAEIIEECTKWEGTGGCGTPVRENAKSSAMQIEK